MKKNLINEILLFISFFIIMLTIYISNYFTGITFEQLFYSLYTSGGTSTSAVSQGIIFVLLGTIFLMLIFKIPRIIFKIKKLNIEKLNKVKKVFSISLLIFSIILILYVFGAFKYIYNYNKNSNLFENYYVDPKDTNITFPEEKQNLIYIFIESLESTNTSIKNGGAKKESLIPNLEKLSKENINFSNNKNIGGAYQISGANWTVAGMISQTSGVPLKVGLDSRLYKTQEFMPGAYSLGDVLKDNGYNNYLMLGSSSSFGGRDLYFKYHGNYQIYDYDYAKEEGIINKNYKTWWGYEDSKMFEAAKDKLLTISKEKEPFNFTILTADTHFVDGYIDPSCKTKFYNHYANSFYCTDQLISKFISWIENQDFYKNTTIVIVGDHLTMQKDLYSEMNKTYKRTIFNTIINSKIETNYNKNRTFTSFDLYPTTLASLGVTIEGNRLGLGTNLYSNEKTIPEIISFKEFDNEINQKSNYYNNHILRDLKKS